MAVNASTGNESAGTNGTDPRPRNLMLGIDADGKHHIYQTRHERVAVIDADAGERDLVQSLGEKDVEDWMVHVENERQWELPNYIAEGVPLRIIDPEMGAEDDP